MAARRSSGGSRQRRGTPILRWVLGAVLLGAAYLFATDRLPPGRSRGAAAADSTAPETPRQNRAGSPAAAAGTGGEAGQDSAREAAQEADVNVDDEESPRLNDSTLAVILARLARVDTVIMRDTVIQPVQPPRRSTAAERLGRLFHWLVTLGALGVCGYLLVERRRGHPAPRPSGDAPPGPPGNEPPLTQAWAQHELNGMSRQLMVQIGDVSRRLEALRDEVRARPVPPPPPPAGSGSGAAAPPVMSRPPRVVPDDPRQDRDAFARDPERSPHGASRTPQYDADAGRYEGGSPSSGSDAIYDASYDDGLYSQRTVALPGRGQGSPAGAVQSYPAELNEEGVFVLLSEEISRPMAEIRWQPGNEYAEGRILPDFVFGLDSRRLAIAFDVPETPSGRYETLEAARVEWREGATTGRVARRGRLRFLG